MRWLWLEAPDAHLGEVSSDGRASAILSDAGRCCASA